MCMKKLIYIRNSIIIILCLTIVCMAVGFIVLSVDLKKEKSKTSSFDVIFLSYEKTNSVKGGLVEPVGEVTILDHKKEADMNFVLSAVHDELTYVFTIQNTGTVPARIVDVIESPDYSIEKFKTGIYPVVISLSDIKGKVLDPLETTDLRVAVYYETNSFTSQAISIPYKIGLITESK